MLLASDAAPRDLCCASSSAQFLGREAVVDACAKDPKLECRLHTFGKDFLEDFSVVHNVRFTCKDTHAGRPFPAAPRGSND